MFLKSIVYKILQVRSICPEVYNYEIRTGIWNFKHEILRIQKVQKIFFFFEQKSIKKGTKLKKKNFLCIKNNFEVKKWLKIIP